MHCCIPTPNTDSSTGMGTIWVTLNMLSAVQEFHELSGNCQGISRCQESGHPVTYLLKIGWAVSSAAVWNVFCVTGGCLWLVCLSAQLCVLFVERCFKCNLVGHFARDCPEEHERCYNCNKLGHIAKDCTADQDPGLSLISISYLSCLTLASFYMLVLILQHTI